LSKYETYVTLTQPHNTTPIFLKENVLEAMEEYANEILKQANVVVDNPEKVLHIQHVSDIIKCDDCGGELYYDETNKYYVCKECKITQ
jgi:Zn finger protein HypA/HybF involved in hydrogenase expression